MGLRVSIYRSDYDSVLNVFRGKSSLTITNLDGPFTPSPDAPAAVLVKRPGLGNYIAPDWADGDGPPVDGPGPMNGGTLAFSHDGRWGKAVGGYVALPIHDRYETWSQYDVMSR